HLSATTFGFHTLRETRRALEFLHLHVEDHIVAIDHLAACLAWCSDQFDPLLHIDRHARGPRTHVAIVFLRIHRPAFFDRGGNGHIKSPVLHLFRGDRKLHRIRRCFTTRELREQTQNGEQGKDRQHCPAHLVLRSIVIEKGTTFGGRQVTSLHTMYSTSPSTVNGCVVVGSTSTVNCGEPLWWRTTIPKFGSNSSTGSGSVSGTSTL